MKGLTGRQPHPAIRKQHRGAADHSHDMIDIFALALSHGLILLGLWRMLSREDFNGDLPDEDQPGA